MISRWSWIKFSPIPFKSSKTFFPNEQGGESRPSSPDIRLALSRRPIAARCKYAKSKIYITLNMNTCNL